MDATYKEKLNQFVGDVFSTTGEFGGMSGWIDTVEKSKDDCYFVAVEDCHFVDPVKQVTFHVIENLGLDWDGESYPGFSYKLTQDNYAWGICKWIAHNKYHDEVTDSQVMKMVLKGAVNLDEIDYDCGDAFNMTQYAMFGEVPFG